MRVIVTRPLGDAPRWVDALQGAGYETLALPLIEIGSVTHTQPIVQAWMQWFSFHAVMFVSAQAVRYFFSHQPATMCVEASQTGHSIWVNGPRCWATGPGTHKALLQAGVPEACIDSPVTNASQFDSEALWQRVATQVKVGQSVLIVRGSDACSVMTAVDHVTVDRKTESTELNMTSNQSLSGVGRDWLAQKLQAMGVSVQFVVAYERYAPVWTIKQQAQAIQAVTDGSVWCFSSSQAITHLARILPTQSWTKARCIATHARIAQTAQALGFGEIQLSRPSVTDVLRSLESLA